MVRRPRPVESPPAGTVERPYVAMLPSSYPQHVWIGPTLRFGPSLTNRFDSGRSGPYSGGPCHAQREGSGSRTLADTKAVARAQRDSSGDSNAVTSAAVHRALFAPSQANECPLRRLRSLLLISGLGVRFPRGVTSRRHLAAHISRVRALSFWKPSPAPTLYPRFSLNTER
jgi:hypothetical protein